MGLSVKTGLRLKSSFQANALLLLNKSIGNHKKWLKLKKNQSIIQGIKQQNLPLQRISSSYKRRLRNYRAILSFYGDINKNTLNRYKLETSRIIQNRRQSAIKGETLIFLFECRLDVLLFRSGLCVSIYESRHLIKTRKILVNGKVCRYINFRVFRLNTCIKVLGSLPKSKFKSSVQKTRHLFVDEKNQFCIFQRWPKINEINFPFLVNPSVFFV